MWFYVAIVVLMYYAPKLINRIVSFAGKQGKNGRIQNHRENLKAKIKGRAVERKINFDWAKNVREMGKFVEFPSNFSIFRKISDFTKFLGEF